VVPLNLLPLSKKVYLEILGAASLGSLDVESSDRGDVAPTAVWYFDFPDPQQSGKMQRETNHILLAKP
jgi:hypothetical protein